MPGRKVVILAILLAALVVASCGMRGGSQQTIIQGVSAGGGTSGVTGSGDTSSGSGSGSPSPVPNGTTLTASAPGITPTTINIGTIQDISGPVPGLFQTALDGVKAWVAYQNARGGIDGRKIVLNAYDAGLNPTNFQQQMVQACTQDFAVVGVMSTVDNAGAVEGEQCGIPDVSDNPTTPQAAAGTNNFAAVPSEPNQYPNGWFKWVEKEFPGVQKKAAIMWPDVSTTEITGQRLRDTATSVGFNFIYQNATNPLEDDFSPYVEAMKSKGIEYFAWQADYQSMARILLSMQQLSWKPKVIDASPTAYNEEFLKLAGSAADGIYINLNIGLFSEAKDNPGMETYLTWLNKAVPGHQPPDIFGVYSWAAGIMFDQAMSAVGPNPTRAQVIDALKNIHNFTGNGIMAPMNPGSHQVSPCFEVVTVKNGQFVRVYPTKPDTYDCTTGTLYTDPKIPPASLSGS